LTEPEQPQHSEEPEVPSDPLVDPPGANFVRSGLLFYGALAIAAVIWRAGFYDERLFLAPGTDPAAPLDWLDNLTLGLGVGLAIVLFSNLITRFTEWGTHLARAMAQALGPLSVPDAVLLALASGLAEEMFFRGALQPRVGFVAASLLFGLIHFVPRREFYPWTLFAVAVGFLFGWMFVATGNLIAPIVAHTVVNGINLPMLVRQYGGVAGDQPDESGETPP